MSCDACDQPRGPLSAVPREGGARHLCPECLHAFVTGEVAALERRMGVKGGESPEPTGNSEPLSQAERIDRVLNRTAYDPITHYSDGTARDWITLEIRAADYRTLNQLAQTWRCSRDNALGILCRAVRLQVWPLGDVLTNYPEFQSWVERVVMAEQAPLREAFRKATPEEQEAMDRERPRGSRRRPGFNG